VTRKSRDRNAVHGPSPVRGGNGIGHALRVALQHQRVGRLVEAEEMYQRILSEQPYHPDALHLRGMLAYELGAYEAAQALIRSAIAVSPVEASFHFDLGLALQAQGKWDLAMAGYRQALTIKPDYAQVLVNMGNIQRSLGQTDEAIASYQEALRIEPNLAEARNNLGVAYHAQGKMEDAVGSLEEALAIRANFPEAHSNLGNVLQDLGKHEEAIIHYRTALMLRPDYLEAHKNLAAALRGLSKPLEALVGYQEAMVLRPEAGTAIRKATILPVIAASAEDLRFYRERLDGEVGRLLATDSLSVADPNAEVGVTNFYLAYQGMNDRPLQEKIARLHLKASPALAWTAEHCLPNRRGASGDERIRIGFLSRYLQNHTIGRFNLGLIQQLSRERFDVTVFHLGKRDEFSAWIANAADRYYHVVGTLASVREFVGSQALDVLFYPEIGMDPQTYFQAFARLAPVQCVGWGHPVTTGVPNVDYFISSEALEPADAAEHYSERLVRLHGLPTYYHRPVIGEELRDRERLGLSKDWTLYVSPQSLFKFHPDFDGFLGDVLRRDPRGRLVLIAGPHASWTEQLLDRMSRANPDVADRIVFIPRLDGLDYFNLLSVADVLLDPPHFGGGNTTYEALGMGIPIVTWPGAFMRGRVTAACYQKMGVMEGVAADPWAYVERAVRLANDSEWRREVAGKIQANSHVLYEDKEVVRELEDFLSQAVAAARDGNLIDWHA